MANAPAPDGRWRNIYAAITGTTPPGQHHEAATGTNPESAKSGHEPDRFDSKGIIMVPVLVVVVTVMAYFLVTGIFSWLEVGRAVGSPTSNPFAKADNEKPLNQRLDRISSWDPKAPVKQPRLEGLPTIDTQRVGVADGPDPETLRSFAPQELTPNTYYLKPQDLYPALFRDPLTGEKLLDEYKWVSKEKHVARIPVDEAIRLLAGKLPANANGVAPSGSLSKPKQSNGGQALPAPVPAKLAEKKDGH